MPYIKHLDEHPDIIAVLKEADERHREAALITFLVTLSGVVLGGIGSAFWGVVAGALALGVQQLGLRKQQP